MREVLEMDKVVEVKESGMEDNVFLIFKKVDLDLPVMLVVVIQF